MITWLGKLPSTALVPLGLVAVFLVGLLDYLTGVELSFAFFYFLPLVVVSWYLGIEFGIIFSVICAAAWAFADFLGGHTYSSQYIFAFNVLVRLCIFLTIATLIYRLRVNMELVMKGSLLAQKSYDIITTSQKVLTVIAENITTYNSELLVWIAEQKEKGRKVPHTIDRTCRKIGANLAALTEITFSYFPPNTDSVEVEDFIDALQAKIEEIQKRNLEQDRFRAG